VNQQTRRVAVAALVVAVLLVLVASFGIGSKPNPLAEKAESSTTNTLVGGLLVIVGGALTLAGNYWMETRRWKRENKYRNYAERRQVYSEFLTRWHSYEDLRTREHRDQEEFVKANLAYQRSFNALSLIAPEEVRTAADAMRREEVRGHRQEASGAPSRFVQAARKDLGIPA